MRDEKEGKNKQLNIYMYVRITEQNYYNHTKRFLHLFYSAIQCENSTSFFM